MKYLSLLLITIAISACSPAEYLGSSSNPDIIAMQKEISMLRTQAQTPEIAKKINELENIVSSAPTDAEKHIKLVSDLAQGAGAVGIPFAAPISAGLLLLLNGLQGWRGRKDKKIKTAMYKAVHNMRKEYKEVRQAIKDRDLDGVIDTGRCIVRDAMIVAQETEGVRQAVRSDIAKLRSKGMLKNTV